MSSICPLREKGTKKGRVPVLPITNFIFPEKCVLLCHMKTIFANKHFLWSGPPLARSFVHSFVPVVCCHLVTDGIQHLVTHTQTQLVSMGPTHLELSVSSQSSSECCRNFSFLASTSIFSVCSERGDSI